MHFHTDLVSRSPRWSETPTNTYGCRIEIRQNPLLLGGGEGDEMLRWSIRAALVPRFPRAGLLCPFRALYLASRTRTQSPSPSALLPGGMKYGLPELAKGEPLIGEKVPQLGSYH